MALKLHVFAPDSTKDPLFYDGDAIAVDLMTLRFKTSNYNQKLVRVEGVVAAYYRNTAYIEEQFTDEAGNTYYCGMPVYCGYKQGKIGEIFTLGNRVEVVGSVTLFSGNWQISGVKAHETKYDRATDSKIISTGHAASFTVTSPYDIVHGDTVTRTATFEELNEDGEEILVERTISYAEFATATTITVENLEVVSFSMTTTQSSYGALSLRCKAADGTQITVRTEPLYDEKGALIPGSTFTGQKITVKGLVEKFTPDAENNPNNYTYQVKVYEYASITFLGE